MKKILFLILFFILSSCATEIANIGTVVSSIGKDFTPEEEKEIGREIAAKILGIYKLYKNDELTKYVNLVGKYVGLNSDEPERKYIFAILDTDTINAYSCPGGYIFITTGLLKILDSEAELATILGHEIAHIEKKHILNEIKRANIISSGAGIVTEKVIGGGGITKELAKKISQKAIETLFKKGLSKRDEYEADLIGFKISCKAGYNANSYIEFLKKLDSLTEDPGMGILLKTHPNPSDRINKISIAECSAKKFVKERFEKKLNFLK